MELKFFIVSSGQCQPAPSMPSAHPPHILTNRIILRLVHVDELALAGVGWVAHLLLDPLLQLRQIRIVIPDKHIVYLGVPGAVHKPLHFLITFEAPQRAAALWIDAAFWVSVGKGSAAKNQGIAFLAIYLSPSVIHQLNTSTHLWAKSVNLLVF